MPQIARRAGTEGRHPAVREGAPGSFTRRAAPIHLAHWSRAESVSTLPAYPGRVSVRMPLSGVCALILRLLPLGADPRVRGRHGLRCPFVRSGAASCWAPKPGDGIDGECIGRASEMSWDGRGGHLGYMRLSRSTAVYLGR